MYLLVAKTNLKLQYKTSASYLLVHEIGPSVSSLYTSYTDFIYLVFFIFKMHKHMHKTSVIYTASSLPSLRKFKPTHTWSDHA